MVILRKKVCLLGSDGVGKTSIILRYTRNTFSESYLMTLGCDFYEIFYERDNDRLELFYWDIASQRNFEKMRSYYLSNSNYVVICVDIQRTEDEYVKCWIEDVIQNSGASTPFLIALNKSDLLSNEDVNKIKANLAQTYKVDVFPVSAKTGANIPKLFEEIGNRLWEKNSR